MRVLGQALVKEAIKVSEILFILVTKACFQEPVSESC